MKIIDCPPPYQLVEAKHGLFLANPNDFYIGRALIEYGEYCEAEWNSLSQLLLDGRDVVEIGANIGSHSVSIAKKIATTGGRLLVVEPQPVVFQNLCANIALNGLMNVRAENAACAERNGKVSFNPPDYLNTNNSGGVSMLDEGKGKITARCYRADDLIPDDFNVGLMKIDVEGFEKNVLEGATATIARCRPIIYTENDRTDLSKDLIEWLWAAGYTLWWDIPRLYNENNFAGFKHNYYDNVCSFNMLCLPKEWNANLASAPIVDASQHPLIPA